MFTNLRNRVCLKSILIILIILVLAGCQLPSRQNGGWKLPIGGKPAFRIAKSNLPREASPQVGPADQAELTDGNVAFALDLYRHLREQDASRNLFFSPYSLSTALAMTYAGARGETESQMAQAFHFSLPQQRLHPAFNSLDLELTNDQQTEVFKLKIANALWGQQDFTFLQDYLDLLARNYGAGMQLLDFTDQGKREQSRKAINDWVSDNTEGKIQELIKEGQLSDYTRLVLTNAVYFKAEWENPFGKSTSEAPFYLLDGSQVQAPVMARRAGFGYLEGEGYQAVGLSYKGGRMRMVILLPAQGQLAAFESALDSQSLAEILNGLVVQDVKLYMPKFKFEAELSLGKTLAEMGMPEAFDGNKADFSGMDGGRDLYLTHVVHKAFIAVDEKGTEAAAASGVIAEIVSLPFEVKIDRPFIFLIQDTQTGAVLFLGRLLDPR